MLARTLARRVAPTLLRPSVASFGAIRPISAPRWTSAAVTAHRGLATATRGAHEPSFTAPPATTRVTTLENGLRVATEDLPGHFVAVGVYVDAGTRHENKGVNGAVSTEGVAHLLDRMAFKVSV